MTTATGHKPTPADAPQQAPAARFQKAAIASPPEVDTAWLLELTRPLRTGNQWSAIPVGWSAKMPHLDVAQQLVEAAVFLLYQAERHAGPDLPLELSTATANTRVAASALHHAGAGFARRQPTTSGYGVIGEQDCRACPHPCDDCAEGC